MKIATPAALIFILGLALVWFAFRGWDEKYGAFGGTFSGVKPA